MLWAVGAKMGAVVPLGLGIYKMELIHVIIQLALIITLSIYYVSTGTSSETESADAEAVEAETVEVIPEAAEPSEDENSA